MFIHFAADVNKNGRGTPCPVQKDGVLVRGARGQDVRASCIRASVLRAAAHGSAAAPAFALFPLVGRVAGFEVAQEPRRDANGSPGELLERCDPVCVPIPSLDAVLEVIEGFGFGRQGNPNVLREQPVVVVAEPFRDVGGRGVQASLN